jgi:hypothetical protein
LAAVAVEPGIEQRVEHQCCRPDAEQQRLGPAIAQREPLVSERRYVVRFRGVRRYEGGPGQSRRQRRRESDQIVAVGPDAVQQHDHWHAGSPGRGGMEGPESRGMDTPMRPAHKDRHRVLSTGGGPIMIGTSCRSQASQCVPGAAP